MDGIWVWVVPAFAMGLLLGSFLNVCIARLPYHESIVKPGSHCPGCLFPIRWYDNVPLVSFLVLRGRCRKCFQRISWRYPVVEMAVGLWFAFIAWWEAYGVLGLSHRAYHRYPSQAENSTTYLIGLVFLGFLLFGLMLMDWETQRLPDAFTITGCAIGFFLVCVQAIFLPAGSGDIHLHKSMRMSSPGSMVEKGDVFLTGPEHLVFGRLVAMLAAFGLLWGISAIYKAVRKRPGLGLGDAKLLAMIAAFLGFWPAMVALFVGVVSCALYASVLLALRRANGLSRLPLGSFLAAGGLIAAIFGQSMIGWYSSLL
jgi:leader peptidase (prepilin peptidase)/N-methyltransferase